MDVVNYLYDQTLQNYIPVDFLHDNPLFETLLINFLSKNLSIIHSQDYTHQFILYLHYELDCLFYRLPKKDIQHDVNKIDNSRLRFEVKKLANNIKKTYINLTNN